MKATSHERKNKRNHDITLTPEAKAIYNGICSAAPEIEKDAVWAAKTTGGHLSDTEYCIKPVSSVEEKIRREIQEAEDNGRAPDRPEKIVSGMKDIIRFTEVCENNKISEATLSIIKKFTDMGYRVVNLKNYFVSPRAESGYKGIHLILESPKGILFEFQIHSRESLEARNNGHVYYNIFRNPNECKERKAYARKIMHRIYDAVPIPNGIESMNFIRSSK